MVPAAGPPVTLRVVVADDQVHLVDVLVREQNNLTDVLRRALAVGDRDLVAYNAMLRSLAMTGRRPDPDGAPDGPTTPAAVDDPATSGTSENAGATAERPVR